MVRQATTTTTELPPETLPPVRAVDIGTEAGQRVGGVIIRGGVVGAGVTPTIRAEAQRISQQRAQEQQRAVLVNQKIRDVNSNVRSVINNLRNTFNQSIRTFKDRNEKLHDLQIQLIKYRSKVNTGGQIESPGLIKEIRRTIARIKTINHEDKLKISETESS